MKKNSEKEFKKELSDSDEKNRKNDLVIHFIRPSPVSKPPSGRLHLFCLRLTVALCVGGAIAGFCIVVIGGVGKDYYMGLKSFMYIGVLSFLVSVVLLVIFCATWGTGGSYIQPQDLVITVPCTCECSSEVPPGHIVIPCTDIGKAKATSKNVAEHSNPTSNLPSDRYCSIKNCICRNHSAQESVLSPVRPSCDGNRQLPTFCSSPENTFQRFDGVHQPYMNYEEQRQALFDSNLSRQEKIDIYKWLSYSEEQSRPASFVTENDSIL